MSSPLHRYEIDTGGISIKFRNGQFSDAHSDVTANHGEVVEGTTHAEHPKWLRCERDGIILWLPFQMDGINILKEVDQTSKEDPKDTLPELPPSYAGNITAEVSGISTGQPERKTRREWNEAGAGAGVLHTDCVVNVKQDETRVVHEHSTCCGITKLPSVHETTSTPLKEPGLPKFPSLCPEGKYTMEIVDGNLVLTSKRCSEFCNSILWCIVLVYVCFAAAVLLGVFVFNNDTLRSFSYAMIATTLFMFFFMFYLPNRKYTANSLIFQIQKGCLEYHLSFLGFCCSRPGICGPAKGACDFSDILLEEEITEHRGARSGVDINLCLRIRGRKVALFSLSNNKSWYRGSPGYVEVKAFLKTYCVFKSYWTWVHHSKDTGGGGDGGG